MANGFDEDKIQITDGAYNFACKRIRPQLKEGIISNAREFRDLLERSIKGARAQNSTQKVKTDEGKLSLVVNLSSDLDLDHPVFAVMLPDRKDISKYPTVVAFLDKEGVDRFKDTGRWSFPHDGAGDVPERLSAIDGDDTIAMRHSVVTPPSEPATTPVTSDEFMMVTYHRVDGTIAYEEYQRDDAMRRAADLAGAAHPVKVRLWREVKVRVRVEIE